MLRDLRPLGTARPAGAFNARANRKVRGGSASSWLSPGGRGRAGRVAGCVAAGLAICGVVVGFRALLLRSARFALTEVRTGELRHLDAGRVLRQSGLQLGRSLFALDLTAAERRLAREPWIAAVRIRRELPHTVAVEIVEREVRLGVALGAVYLVDDKGDVFKRARPDELAGVPIVTGLQRERFLGDPARSSGVLRRALELDRAWRDGGRAPAGELHHDGGYDLAATFTAFFTHGGRPVGVRLGAPDGSTTGRLARMDAVLAALDRAQAPPAFIHLDQRVQLDRVSVRLAGDAELGVAQAL